MPTTTERQQAADALHRAEPCKVPDLRMVYRWPYGTEGHVAQVAVTKWVMWFQSPQGCRPLPSEIRLWNPNVDFERIWKQISEIRLKSGRNQPENATVNFPNREVHSSVFEVDFDLISTWFHFWFGYQNSENDLKSGFNCVLKSKSWFRSVKERVTSSLSSAEISTTVVDRGSRPMTCYGQCSYYSNVTWPWKYFLHELLQAEPCKFQIWGWFTVGHTIMTPHIIRHHLSSTSYIYLAQY